MRIENEARPSNTTYLSGKPENRTVDDFIYLDLQIYELVSCLGAEEAIRYLKNKIKTIKQQMEGK